MSSEMSDYDTEHQAGESSIESIARANASRILAAERNHALIAPDLDLRRDRSEDLT